MKFYWQFLIGLFWIQASWAQTPLASSPPPTQLLNQVEMKVYVLNNAFQYDSSIVLLRKLIDAPGISDQDRFYAFLYLSYTYKRLFDYKSTLQQLDSALVYGQKTPHRAYFEANISCQKAYVLFDTHRYPEADKRMQQLARTNYRHLDKEQKAKIMMQEAYLLYLNRQYPKAETRYNIALSNLYRSSPCDVPMIYTKLIQLYEKMDNEVGMIWAAKRSITAADSCKITKYSIYTYEELYKAYEAQGNIKAAYEIRNIYDSLNTLYNKDEYLLSLKEQELKYQQGENKISTQLYQSNLKNERQKNFILVGILVTLTGFVTSYLLWQRQRQLKREKEISLNFTKQLLQNMEEERKRIASDLHDSINYELLSLKKSFYPKNTVAEEKIDQIINDVRIISRNLHPTMFDKIGLVPNLEQLIERLQEQHNLMVSTDIHYHHFLKTEEEIHLYRIVQEALTNVIKYARAHAAKITLTETAEKVRLMIRDNGLGFDVAKILAGTTSFGLHNIIERSRIIGGTTKIQSSPRGTSIEIEIKK